MFAKGALKKSFTLPSFSEMREDGIGEGEDERHAETREKSKVVRVVDCDGMVLVGTHDGLVMLLDNKLEGVAKFDFGALVDFARVSAQTTGKRGAEQSSDLDVCVTSLCSKENKLLVGIACGVIFGMLSNFSISPSQIKYQL